MATLSGIITPTNVLTAAEGGPYQWDEATTSWVAVA
jgi:hypothetical protein